MNTDLTTTLPTPSPYAFVVNGQILFDPYPKQLEFMQSQETNVFFYGNRGGGKSITARMFCHGMALKHKNFRYIVVRRSFPELTKNHLIYLNDEMKLFGGSYNKTEHMCYYPNGSIGFYAQCASDADVKKVVGAEAALIVFDEAPELEWEWMRLITASVRVRKDSGLKPMVRYLGNPIGPSIDQLWSYFRIDGEAPPDPLSDPEYHPSDWRAIEIRLEDNLNINTEEYKKQFSGIPAHIRKAWLDGIRVVEGAYFIIDPSIHHINTYPDLKAKVQPHTGRVLEPAPLIYRAIDWGTHDETVCLWIAVHSNGRAIVFKEMQWTHTTAQQVAKEIKEATEAMGIKKVVATYCDPTMFRGQEEIGTSIGDKFESGGIPLTKSINDRSASGFAISEWLNTMLEDGLPKLQMNVARCPNLTKTLPVMRSDPKNPEKIADHPRDHWTITLGYFCQSAAVSPRTPTYMEWPANDGRLIVRVPKPEVRRTFKLGSESIKRRR